MKDPQCREDSQLVLARWQVCSSCACTYVLVHPEHKGKILCYECIVEGVRL